MNEMFELWSLPWHALQRSLAAGASLEGQAHGTAAKSLAMMGTVIRAGGPIRAAAGASWLARARANVEPPARRGG